MSTCLLISTYNRSSLLENSLNRLAQLTLPDEILVVDDGGDDYCEETLARVEIGCEKRYIYTHNPGQSLCSHARNIGLKNTDCDFIVQTEPEIMFDTDVIRQLFYRFAERGQEQVIEAGTVRHLNVDGTLREIHRGWVATYAVLYPRDWLLAINGWDETFPDPWGWDDTDVMTRLRISGHGQFIDEEIAVTHQWHPALFQGTQDANIAHFFGKKLDDPGADPVANRGIAWGEITPR